MIRVTIEMVPKGSEEDSYTLAQGVIINDGTGTLASGSYDYGITGQVKRPGHDPGIWKQGKVGGFARKRDNVWRLLKAVLDDAL